MRENRCVINLNLLFLVSYEYVLNQAIVFTSLYSKWHILHVLGQTSMTWAGREIHNINITIF